jgi:hydrogenase maturation protein HypF
MATRIDKTTKADTGLVLTVRGIVQGVGFRPYVARLARRFELAGAVQNTMLGVRIEVEGRAESVEAFREEFLETGPMSSLIREVEEAETSPAGAAAFEILESQSLGLRGAWITPDLATCPDCVREIFDPGDRRYRYPFTSCARCGPRFSILARLPFDRDNTVMEKFPLCTECNGEYIDPDDRRYHAQTMTCPECGPRLSLLDREGRETGSGEEAIRRAVESLRGGKILALQGIGGFQLMVDATREESVKQLRARKQRPDKPLAVMFATLPDVENCCDFHPKERELLQSPEAPIVLAKARRENPISPSVAPGNPYLGVMIPYSPLHHLLMSDLEFPVVATSGNISGEPICIDPQEALQRLSGIADLFVVHNRPILRPVDDSVARVIGGEGVVLRAARGYAPMTLPQHTEPREPVLAVGGHFKSTVGLSVGRNLIVSQHIGELDHPTTRSLHRKTVGELQFIYRARPSLVAHDLHPDYGSTSLARRMGRPTKDVQHHHAHVLSCMAEHGLRGPVLGISWDGTGLGLDETIWGGEFLVVDGLDWRRVGHLRSFRLPGGESAIREPRRTALGLLYECLGEDTFEQPFSRRFTSTENRILRQMLSKGVNSPRTSAAGRLYDAVASLIGLRDVVSFEGQAAMDMEFAALECESAGAAYPFEITMNPETSALVLDWEPMVASILEDLRNGISKGEIASRFETTMVDMAVKVCRHHQEHRVILTGGCFQNRSLTERMAAALGEEGHQVFTHRRVPPNDGGLVVGQALAAWKGM